MLHEKVGIPFDRIRLLQGDSDELIAGGGTGGSKSIMASGAAIVEAGEKVVEAGKAIAAVALEAAVEDIEFSAGTFAIAGTDRQIGIMELAETVRTGLTLPDGSATSLDVQHIHKERSRMAATSVKWRSIRRRSPRSFDTPWSTTSV